MSSVFKLSLPRHLFVARFPNAIVCCLVFRCVCINLVLCFLWHSLLSLFVLLFALCTSSRLHLRFPYYPCHPSITSPFVISSLSWCYPLFRSHPLIPTSFCFSHAQRPRTSGVRGRGAAQPSAASRVVFLRHRKPKAWEADLRRQGTAPRHTSVTLGRCRDLQSLFIYSYLLFFPLLLSFSGLSFVYFRGFLSLLFLSTLGLAFFVCLLLIFFWLWIWMRKR